jgi:hypothetical protein
MYINSKITMLRMPYYRYLNTVYVIITQNLKFEL